MSFTDLNLKSEYRSPHDNITGDFFNPVLKLSVTYKRAVGFFSSSALFPLLPGIFALVKNGGKIQLITSPRLFEEDIAAINCGLEQRGKISDNDFTIKNLIQGQFDDRLCLNFLSNLIASERLEIKIAKLKNTNSNAMFHEKLGLMYDANGNVIAFSGSMNESFNAFENNYESIDVFTS